jgi:phosphatidylglycerophosphate synthase
LRFSLHEVRARGQRTPDTMYDRIFTRNVSVFITWLLAPLGASPNVVSGINFLVGVGGCVLVAVGADAALVIVGIGLIHLYAVLDSVDGELARLLDRRSVQGMFLEDWSAYAMMAAFPLAVGAYLAHQGAYGALILGIAYAAIGRNAMPAVRRAIAQSPPTVGPVDPVVSSGNRAPGWKGIVDRTVLHQTNIRVVLTTLILVEILMGRPGQVVTLPFYLYMLALFAREAGIVAMTVQGTLLDREWERLRGGPRVSPGTAPTVVPAEQREPS